MIKRPLAWTIVTILLLFFMAYFYQRDLLRFIPSLADIEQNKIISRPKFEYGLPVDSFVIYKGVLQPGQLLSDILLDHHIPYPKIHKLMSIAGSVLDMRQLMPGRDYVVFCSRDSAKAARFFVYEPSVTTYVVFDLNDSMNVFKKERPVEVKTLQTKNAVNSSLWSAMEKVNASPLLALELSKIYAWTIDFFRIQKGDRFSVIYEENYVYGKSIGIKRILAACFTHHNHNYHAYYFEQDSKGDYFDENANSLRKAFLKAPVKYTRISSAYSKRRFHPVLKRNQPHLGTDYAASAGTPIMSTGDGMVTEAAYTKGNGRYIKIRHNTTYSTQYLHMSGFAKGIRSGKYVRQGEVIGYVGSTGLATGPHVCYRFWKNNKQVDPMSETFLPALPVKKENLVPYDMLKEELKQQLETL